MRHSLEPTLLLGIVAILLCCVSNISLPRRVRVAFWIGGGISALAATLASWREQKRNGIDPPWREAAALTYAQYGGSTNQRHHYRTVRRIWLMRSAPSEIIARQTGASVALVERVKELLNSSGEDDEPGSAGIGARLPRSPISGNGQKPLG